MSYLKSKEKIVSDSLGSINESVYKMGDTYNVKTLVPVPKSLINAFVSKAKKENDIDPRENWSDTDLAELFVNYIIANFINIESIPVDKVLGDKLKNQTVQTDIQPQEIQQSAPQQPQKTQPQSQPQSQTQPQQKSQPTGEIKQ